MPLTCFLWTFLTLVIIFSVFNYANNILWRREREYMPSTNFDDLFVWLRYLIYWNFIFAMVYLLLYHELQWMKLEWNQKFATVQILWQITFYVSRTKWIESIVMMIMHVLEWMLHFSKDTFCRILSKTLQTPIAWNV